MVETPCGVSTETIETKAPLEDAAKTGPASEQRESENEDIAGENSDNGYVHVEPFLDIFETTESEVGTASESEVPESEVPTCDASDDEFLVVD